VSSYLLDVNVLIALLWPDHECHLRAQRWFRQSGAQGWATCPITEAGFVRIVSNPAFTQHPVSAQDAFEVLHASLGHPAHHFWAEDIGIAEAFAYVDRSLLGHQQVTDAYLLGLAIHKKGRLATLDAGIRALCSEESAAKATIALL
jgi:uncharacterized protein